MDTPDEARSDARIATWSPKGPAMLAPRSGKLSVRNGCVVLLATDGSETLPVFPAAATRWNAADQSLELHGEVHHIGDEVTLNGGATTRGSDELRAGADNIDRCGDASALFLVF